MGKGLNDTEKAKGFLTPLARAKHGNPKNDALMNTATKNYVPNSVARDALRVPLRRRRAENNNQGDRPSTNVAIYARVSTNDQNSLPQQIEKLEQYAARRGWNVAWTEAEISSGSQKRDGRERIMRAASRRDVDAVIVANLDRWGRSMRDLVNTLGTLEEQGVSFVSINESLDSSTAAGRAMFGLLAVFAEFESSLLRERVKAGIAFKMEKGFAHGRPKIQEGIRQKARDLQLQGLDTKQIATELGVSRTSVKNFVKEGNP